MIRYVVLFEFLIAAGFLLGLMVRGPGRRSGIFLYGFGTVCVLLLALGAAEVTLRLEHDASWRTFLAFTAGTVSSVTMVWVNIHDYKQEKKHPYKHLRRESDRQTTQ